MNPPVQPIPSGYSRVTPYLIVRGAERAIDFYRDAFGATLRMKLDMPGGGIGHAEIMIGDSMVMLADEFPEMGYRGPESFNGSPVSLALYVQDVDASVALAVKLGAKIVRPVTDQFYGDRSGMITDPFGHTWNIATHVEDVPEEELQRRLAAMGEEKKS